MRKSLFIIGNFEKVSRTYDVHFLRAESFWNNLTPYTKLRSLPVKPINTFYFK